MLTLFIQRSMSAVWIRNEFIRRWVCRSSQLQRVSEDRWKHIYLPKLLWKLQPYIWGHLPGFNWMRFANFLKGRMPQMPRRLYKKRVQLLSARYQSRQLRHLWICLTKLNKLGKKYQTNMSVLLGGVHSLKWELCTFAMAHAS